uniref:BHLH domain-containing protein n=1 Tax=Opuntia streptacantha TaxID=393608 RepID=A0A7C9DWQ5_OPUST
MGAPPQSLLDSLNLKGMILEKKGMVLENKGTMISTNPSYISGSLWSKVLEAQREKLGQTRRKGSKNVMRNNRRLSMKRRGILRREVSRRGESRIERRVRTLKRLIPRRQSKGLEGLFKDTATYIMSLQMRVRVMQIMVDVLTSAQDE